MSTTPDARTRAQQPYAPVSPSAPPALTGGATTTGGGGTKRCPKCGRDKARRHFHNDRRRPDGKCSLCKQCRRPMQAQTSKRIAARKRAYSRAYRAAHPDYEKARKCAAYWADPETARAMALIRTQRSRARRRAARGAQA